MIPPLKSREECDMIVAQNYDLLVLLNELGLIEGTQRAKTKNPPHHRQPMGGVAGEGNRIE